MWRLVSTWDRADGSITHVYLWSQDWRSPRRPRRAPRRSPPPTELGARAAAVLGPVVVSHGIDVAPQPSGDSVVWCSRVRTVDQDVDQGVDPDDPGWCTDLWVHLDPTAHTISIDLEGHGLAEHVTGRTHWDGPISIDLDDDLDVALGIAGRRLDRLCGDVIEST